MNSFLPIILERKVGEVAISERNETSFVYHLVGTLAISYLCDICLINCGLLDCKTVRIFWVFKYARAVKQKVWNEAWFFFSTFDMDKFRKFRRHH